MTQLEAMVMMDEKQDRYADLIECSARILAFDGIIDAALPVLVSALTSEAVDLRNGWAEFCPIDETGAADLPIVDAVIAEVFARSNALRREIFGNLRRAATAKDVATRMREHLAGLRKQHSAKTLRKIAHG
jgi:hypothetical protein